MTIKKKLIIIYIILFFSIINCKDETNEDSSTQKIISLNDPIGEDIVDYITNHMRPLVKTMEGVMNDYSSIYANYSDSYNGFLIAIDKDVLPKFNILVKNVEKVNPKTEEVRKIHIIFVKACKDMLSGLELLKKGLKNENPELIIQANEKISLTDKDFNLYMEKMTELSKKHNVDYLFSTEEEY